MTILVEVILASALFVTGGALWWIGSFIHPFASFVLAYVMVVFVLFVTKHVLNFFSKGTLPDGRQLTQVLSGQNAKAQKKIRRK